MKFEWVCRSQRVYRSVGNLFLPVMSSFEYSTKALNCHHISIINPGDDADILSIIALITN